MQVWIGLASPRVRNPAADLTARATVVLPLSYLSRFHQDDHQSDMRMTCRAMPCLNQKLKVVVMEANSEGCCAGPVRALATCAVCACVGVYMEAYGPLTLFLMGSLCL